MDNQTCINCDAAYQKCWDKGLLIDADAMKRQSNGLITVEQAQEYLEGDEYAGEWGSV
jgi:hypothetical protein